MDWKKSFIVYIAKHIIAAVVILFVVGIAVLWWINSYTQHGKTEVLPDLRGMYVEEAEAILKKTELYSNVVDSMYVSGKPLGTILEQTPPAGSTVKRNRPVYLIINSREVRKIPLPDVNDVSFRQADAMIKSVGLQVGSVQYVPSEYRDLVLSVTLGGETISAGTRLPEGTAVTLVVGRGLSEGESSYVPSLIGLTLDVARQKIASSSFVVGAIEYDVNSSGNAQEYFIYDQHPNDGTSLLKGSRIDIWLSKDSTLLDSRFRKNNRRQLDDEEFF